LRTDVFFLALAFDPVRADFARLDFFAAISHLLP